MEDGQTSDSRMGSKYQWEPNPIMAVGVGVITVIIVFIPAVCSVCYHVHRKSQGGKVRVKYVMMYSKSHKRKGMVWYALICTVSVTEEKFVVWYANS